MLVSWSGCFDSWTDIAAFLRRSVCAFATALCKLSVERGSASSALGYLLRLPEALCGAGIRVVLGVNMLIDFDFRLTNDWKIWIEQRQAKAK